MGEFFSDELSEVRQRLYWQVFQPQCSIEAWEWACLSAMQRETFHKVPLPAVLSAYTREYRTLEREVRQRLLDQQRALEERKYLENPPLSQAELAEQLQVLFAQLNETMEFPAPRRAERISEYRQPLDEAGYAERKARLKAQAEQLQKEANPDD